MLCRVTPWNAKAHPLLDSRSASVSLASAKAAVRDKFRHSPEAARRYIRAARLLVRLKPDTTGVFRMALPCASVVSAFRRTSVLGGAMSATRRRCALLATIVVILAAARGSGQQRPPASQQTPTGLPPSAPTQPSPSGLLIPVQPPPAAPSKLLQMYKPVTAHRLKEPEDGDWLMVRRTYDGWGYSPLDQITTATVKRLQPVWLRSTGMNNGHQAPPIVNNGVMFVATSYNQVIALNARTGEELWRYRSPSPPDARVSKPVNRGVALYGDKVFF